MISHAIVVVSANDYTQVPCFILVFHAQDGHILAFFCSIVEKFYVPFVCDSTLAGSMANLLRVNVRSYPQVQLRQVEQRDEEDRAQREGHRRWSRGKDRRGHPGPGKNRSL